MGLSFVCTPLTEMGDFRIIFWPSSSSFLLWFRAVGSRKEREWKDICLPRFPVLGGPRGERACLRRRPSFPQIYARHSSSSPFLPYIQDDFSLDLYPLLLLLFLQGRIIRGSVGEPTCVWYRRQMEAALASAFLRIFLRFATRDLPHVFVR